jgi:uncharacterized protein (DUF952 family)
VSLIYHIAEAAKWLDAQHVHEYRQSTIGRTLEDEGFIHCGRADQVERVANAAYRAREDLVLLVIDPSKLRASVRYENLEGGSELFPHVYGPLNVEAIVEVATFRPGPTGRFTGPSWGL